MLIDANALAGFAPQARPAREIGVGGARDHAGSRLSAGAPNAVVGLRTAPFARVGYVRMKLPAYISLAIEAARVANARRDR